MKIPPRLPQTTPPQRTAVARPPGSPPAVAAGDPTAASARTRPADAPDLPDSLDALLSKVQDRLARRIDQGDLSERQLSGLNKSMEAFEEALQSLASAGSAGELDRDGVAAGARSVLARLEHAIKGILDAGSSEDPPSLGGETFSLGLDVAGPPVDRIA